MVHVPGVLSETYAAPEMEQIPGVVELNITGRPELAVAFNATYEFRVCDGIDAKVMLCGVLPATRPVS